MHDHAWVLAVVFFKQREIHFYTSHRMVLLGHDEAIRFYLSREHQQVMDGATLNMDNWVTLSNPNGAPRDGGFCGPYVCLLADFISLDYALGVLGPNHFRAAVDKITLAIIKGETIP